MTPKVLVLGATGTTGSRVSQQLAARGAWVRRASRSAAGTVHFDWGAPTSWGPVLAGAERLYLVAPTDGSDPAPAVERFLAAAARAGVGRVVLLSSSALEPAASGPGALPALVRGAVPEWTVLRPSWFMSNVLGNTPLAAGLRAGHVVTATGEGRVAFIDPQDIADVAVHALLAEPSLQTDLVLTGPAAHSYDELTRLVARRRGHPVRHESVSTQEYADHLAGAGVPGAYAPLLAGLDEAIRHGSEDRVTDTVARLTGHPPRTFEDYLDQHADELLADNPY